MKKIIGIVFFADLNCVNWKEEVNEKLIELLNPLNMNLGKSVGHSIGLKFNNIPEIVILERPAFSGKDRDIDLSFMDNRMEFKFITEKDSVVDEIKSYFNYLEILTEKLNLKIERIGINVTNLLEEKIDLKNKYLNLGLDGSVSEFGLKQNTIQKIYEENPFSPEINLLIMLESTKEKFEFLVDINTIPNGKEVEKSVRKSFLEKALEKIDVLIDKTIEVLKE